jgi:hypothetical protein
MLLMNRIIYPGHPYILCILVQTGVKEKGDRRKKTRKNDSETKAIVEKIKEINDRT